MVRVWLGKRAGRQSRNMGTINPSLPPLGNFVQPSGWNTSAFRRWLGCRFRPCSQGVIPDSFGSLVARSSFMDFFCRERTILSFRECIKGSRDRTANYLPPQYTTDKTECKKKFQINFSVLETNKGEPAKAPLVVVIR